MCPLFSRLWYLAALAVPASGFGQSQWASAEMPGLPVGFLRQVYASPTHDTIYFAGLVSMTGISQDWQETNSILRYTNGQWDTLGVINGQVMTVVHYRDTLLAGGAYFLSCSNVPCSQVAYWDGNAWLPYGEFGTYHVRKLRVLDGELYAVGAFHEVDGQPASGVAKRMGNRWEPVGEMDSGDLRDIAKYDGKLVVIGNITFPNGRDIAQWDGNEWTLLGPGLIHLLAGPLCLAVYEGDLYVGGKLPIVHPHNPGQNIMRWDGTQFHALGQGIQRWLGDIQSTATVLDMVEHGGKLFVGGGYRAAGGIEALGLATWDGVEWCAVQGDFQASGGIWSMDFYHDTLFVATGQHLDGQFVNGAAKFTGVQYEEQCSGPADIASDLLNEDPQIYPNPACTYTSFTWEGSGNIEHQLFDSTGRMIRYGSAIGTGEVIIPLDGVPPGLYQLRISSSKGPHQTFKLLVQ
jgi:hypothetical protein